MEKAEIRIPAEKRADIWQKRGGGATAYVCPNRQERERAHFADAEPLQGLHQYINVCML